MSVYKTDGSKTYTYSFWIEGRRFHGNTGKTEKRAAKEVERKARIEAQKLIDAEKSQAAQVDGSAPLTMDVAAGRYWTEVGQFHAGANTTWTDLERLIGYFGGDRRLDSITDNDITQLVSWRRGHRFKDRETLKNGEPAPFIASATVNRTTVDLLRKIFRRARTKWKAQFPDEPDWKSHRLKERGEIVRELKVDEEIKLSELLAEGYRDLWRFALASGLRLRECFITWDQIDWHARTITVTQKGKRKHTIPLSNDMIAIIAPQRGKHPVHVFTYVCRRTQKKYGLIRGERYPLTYEGMKSAWRRNRGKAGADDMRFHDNRHNHAVFLLRKTGNLKAVQRMLGHANIATTAKFYAHVMLDDLRDLLDGPARNDRIQPQRNPQSQGGPARKAKA